MIRTTLALVALAALGRSEARVQTCFSCASFTAGANNPMYASALKQIFGQWPAQTADCKSGPGMGESVPCNSFCVTQVFSIKVPSDSQGGMQGMVRGCASTILHGNAVNSPMSTAMSVSHNCVASHTAPMANGLIVAHTDTYPCNSNNCNGGAPGMNLPTCDNTCGHNTCPVGACAPVFDQVSYSCGGKIAPKVPPTPAPSTSGWTKAAQMFLNSIDVTVDPCQDFYAFSCNNWIKNHPIPAHASSISNFGAIQQNIYTTVGNALMMPTNGSNNWTTSIVTAQNLFQSCMNSPTNVYTRSRWDDIISTIGDWPVLNETFSETEVTFFKRSAILAKTYGIATFITPSLDTNWVNPKSYALYLGQATLTYPAIYYNTNATAAIIRNSIMTMMVESIIEVGKIRGQKIIPAQIKSDILAMINFEFSVAKEIIPAAKERQYKPMYNPYTVANATSRWPLIDWNMWLATYLNIPLPAPKGTFIVTEPTFFDALNKQLSTVDSFSKKQVQRIFQNYIVWRAIYDKIQFLPPLQFPKTRAAFLKAKQDLEFIEELAPMQTQCTSMVINMMPYVAGRLYTDFHFKLLPNSPRDFIRKMTTSVMASFRQMVANLNWMDSATKILSINKVNNLLQNYAYPDWAENDAILNAWYAGLNISASDSLWTALDKLTAFQYSQQQQRLLPTTKVNRRDWGGTPAIVNAWYQPELNSITFPAGILNAPFFEADFPDAVNYGAMGLVEGHELTHGFDDQGVQWTGNGTLNPWIDAASLAGFKAMAQCVIDEYHTFCYRFPNMTQFCVNGVQTQGEDIADNGGMKASFLALKAAELLNGPQPPLPGLEQYSNDQLYFMAFGQIWCENVKPSSLQQQTMLDPHAPARVRVVASIRNFPPFQQAFNCPANSPMSPTKHCTVW